MKLPRNVTRYKLSSGGFMYRFNPTQDLVDNRIVERKNLGTDKRKAVSEAAKLNRLIDDYRSGKIAGAMPSPNTKLQQVVQSYYASNKFKALTSNTQIAYEYALRDLCNATYEGKRLGDMRMQDISIKHCNHVYQQWVTRGVTTANSKRRVCSVVFNYAMKLEAIQRNPMALVDAVTTKTRKVMWTKQQIKDFLTVAYSDFRYRSIGLIVHMSYEWCQRVGDMRNLTWDSIDLEAQRVTITQSKRGPTVHLPITDGLARLLKQQRLESTPHTEYDVPQHRSSEKAGRSYAWLQIARLHLASKRKGVRLTSVKQLDFSDTGRKGLAWEE